MHALFSSRGSLICFSAGENSHLEVKQAWSLQLSTNLLSYSKKENKLFESSNLLFRTTSKFLECLVMKRHDGMCKVLFMRYLISTLQHRRLSHRSQSDGELLNLKSLTYYTFTLTLSIKGKVTLFWTSR